MIHKLSWTGCLAVSTMFAISCNEPVAPATTAETDTVGPAGPAGPPGDPGPQGAAGPAGPVGPQGPTGIGGAQGPNGTPGAKGDVGPVGARGIQGRAGLNGAQGLVGSVGVTGGQGPMGAQGQTGPIGPTGAAGPQGVPGRQGLTGERGPAGTTGPASRITGLTGLAGPEGAVGDRGPPGVNLTQRAFRYATWSSYDQAYGWMGTGSNGDSLMFGGVTPQLWGDSNGVAWLMSSDAEVMRTLFNKKIYPGTNAMITADAWYVYSSTNSKHTGVLMRIKNSTNLAVPWTVSFYYTCYVDWGERASASLNGAADWQCTSNSGARSFQSLNLSIPANKTSTFIVISGSSAPSGSLRTNFLAFQNSSLDLPPGLSFVDDLHAASGNIWQN